ncbi:P-loop containing nucleoside triphosphate hydrolase protein [Xylariaceae sp. FL0016]|nr:P-loop containing nucleoside triphosphate hydrolase protein [Xylariaceae sp. FL0016]
MSLPIIILTGPTACGKGTLGKRLADEFGFYHVSMGDARRELEAQIRAPDGLPGMPDNVNQHALEAEPIPDEVLARFRPVPVILPYWNCRVRQQRSWMLAPEILNEKLSEARAAGTYRAVIVDGFPVTAGRTSETVIRGILSSFSGLTIVIDSPREVARRRYLERARGDTNEETFERRMGHTDVILPQFIEFMSQFGSVVHFTNEGTMTIDAAYSAFVGKLTDSSVFQTLTQLPAPTN